MTRIMSLFWGGSLFLDPLRGLSCLSPIMSVAREVGIDFRDGCC